MSKLLFRTGVALCVAVPVAANAQDLAQTVEAAPPNDAVAPAGHVDEIVVTARRVKENLQDAPVAVTNFSERVIRERAITTVADIGKFTPSLSFDSAASPAGSSNSITVFLRGIGQTDFNLTVDPGVGLYLDGVYISRSVGALLQTSDVDSIQVLRGPQGTLFGKNTIGGAVVVTSRAPTHEYGAYVEVTAGRFNRFDTSARIDVPVADTFRFAISGLLRARDGYMKRLFDGDRKGNQNSASGRLVAEWEPTPALSLHAAADYTRTREEGPPTTLLEVNENAVFPVFNNIFKNAPACLPPSPIGNTNCYNAQWITGNVDTTNENAPNRSSSDVWGSSLTAEWRTGPVTVRSITAYRKLSSAFVLDIDQSPLFIQQTSNNYRQRQFSQELQLQGDALHKRLNYLFGLYYLHEGGTDLNGLVTAPTDFRSGGSVRNDSYAIFSQLIFHPSARIGLTLGGRFTRELKRFTPDQVVLRVDPLAQAPLPPGAPFPFFLTNPVTSGPAGPQPLRVGDLILPPVERTVTAAEFTPSATADYKIAPDVLTYLSYSRGFKSGGFTQRVFPPEPITPSFNPEYAQVIEVGLKTLLFDRRVRFNAAAYSTSYKDLQVIVADGFAPKVRNAGRARIRGIEAETQVALARSVHLTGSFSYLDARYLTIDPRAAPVTINSKLANAPRFTASAGLNFDAYRGRLGHVVIQGDWAFRSATYKDAINTPALRQAPYSVFNTSLDFHSTNRWSIQAGVINLTDKRYIVTGYSDLNFIGATYAIYSRPREWFVKLGYQL